MRSSSDIMSARPAGRRHPATDGALGQDPGVSDPVQPSLFERRGTVVPFPVERMRERVIDRAFEQSRMALGECRSLIRELRARRESRSGMSQASPPFQEEVLRPDRARASSE